MTKIEKANYYYDNWETVTGLHHEQLSNREISLIDYMSGYNQALKDNKKEVEELKLAIEDLKDELFRSCVK